MTSVISALQTHLLHLIEEVTVKCLLVCLQHGDFSLFSALCASLIGSITNTVTPDPARHHQHELCNGEHSPIIYDRTLEHLEISFINLFPLLRFLLYNSYKLLSSSTLAINHLPQHNDQAPSLFLPLWHNQTHRLSVAPSPAGMVSFV
jgi:hypothetical protein